MEVCYDNGHIVIYACKFEPIDSRMYIIVENNEALIIDPCISKDALQFLIKSYVNKVNVILTHEHYDHISGVNWLRDNFECNVICSEMCAENIKEPSENLSLYFDVLFLGKNGELQEKLATLPYSCNADKTFNKVLEFMWGKNKIKLIETPGHSRGSICIKLNQEFIFTGDTVVNGNVIIMKLPGGSKKEYFNYTLPFLKSLSEDILVLPGHGREEYLKNLKVLGK